MKASALFVLAPFLVPSLARADATIHQTTQDTFTVSFEKASGEPATTSLRPGVSIGGYQSLPTLKDKTLAISVTSAAGDVLASRGVVDDRHYLLLPHADGTYSIEEAGVAGSPMDPYPGVVIINTLREPFTLDLFGSSGQAGVKNVRLATALDVKQVIALSPQESDYRAVFHLADGTTVTSETSVSRGRYAYVMRNYKGDLVVAGLGYIVKPPATKPAKPATPVKRAPKARPTKASK